MGKGGCLSAAAAPPDVGADLVKPGRGLDGISVFLDAVRSITSNRWAQEKAEAHRNAHSKRRDAAQAGGPGSLSWDSVKTHNTEDDCWIVVKNKVYDVTAFAPDHPGGRAIIAYAGRDATDVFATFHASATWSLLKQYYVGDVEDPVRDDMLDDFRKMRAGFVRRGLFTSSKLYYVAKVLTLLGVFFTAAAVLFSGENTWAAAMTGAFVLGLGWQQAGWLAHDFAHHQVFRNRRLNDAATFFLGNVCQGFSADWWKNKHNTHHAVPNECDEHDHAVDPDIDTLPLLAWSKEMLETVPAAQRGVMRYQHYLLFPILCFARITWAQQSYAHALLLSGVTRQGVLESALITLHYALVGGLAFSTLSVAKAVTFMLAAQIFSGFMLALVFIQSHNAMEVYSDKKDFVSAQIVSTRDIDSNLWMDWFTGGLNYQIEHHLFPTLPRHNLGKVKDDVVAFCKRHGFVYESCGMDTGTFRVLERLADVASHIA